MWHKRDKTEEYVPLTEQHFFYRRRPRNYEKRSHRRLYLGCCLAGIALLAVIVSFSAVRIGMYLWQENRSEQLSAELRDMYHDGATTAPVLSAEATAAPAQAPEAGRVGSKLLPGLQYPQPDAVLRARFEKLQRRNKDIIGWLTIDGLLDEAVVQRDNAYYLRRDYLGYHNVNGSIFLDEGCNLSRRPYTYILYGHNMKTQVMFGSLLRYDEPAFYHGNPFISFDTSHEAGRYVIFSVATISLNRSDYHYVDINKLDSTTVMWREEIISALQTRSRYSPVIDVRADDQVLVLITCKDEESDERRVVAARRIREDETEAELLRLIQSSYRQR